MKENKNLFYSRLKRDQSEDTSLKRPLKIRTFVSNYQHNERSLLFELVQKNSHYPKCDRQIMWSLIKVKPDGEKLISSADEWHLTELQSDDISSMSE